MRDKSISDDIYEGFDELQSSINANSLFSSNYLQTALKTASKGRRPNVSNLSIIAIIFIMISWATSSGGGQCL